ncbi:uncharacterized protein TRIVIDRAFT_228172 [Trichoderma virens Gv29-8]|uniref:Uncharacterized protein n=1 Tax=Hypocrea virens (strain Gv29-8 / FGSC 10586) TaxID=413071 RepID=G9NBP4_HYPVG|nr:uncharacterized protein TRIVIDRAFT_228172 [Trichoderma virens Gv29-8]EHK16248.1 hypothetical protein TRIVIDRAFT_228172 [Trichoderma virens Gv29-8]UKZ55977.1 hypothetical protein TrVGV298_009801 [Trichoderma virens]
MIPTPKRRLDTSEISISAPKRLVQNASPIPKGVQPKESMVDSLRITLKALGLPESIAAPNDTEWSSIPIGILQTTEVKEDIQGFIREFRAKLAKVSSRPYGICLR